MMSQEHKQQERTRMLSYKQVSRMKNLIALYFGKVMKWYLSHSEAGPIGALRAYDRHRRERRKSPGSRRHAE